MVRSLIGILSVLACLTATAQSNKLVGIWVLKVKENQSGPAYENGVPKQMKIKVTSDSMFIERLYVRDANSDYSISENLSLNGTPTWLIRSQSKRQSVLKKGADGNSLSIKVSYKGINTDKQTSADFTEHWTIEANGKELIIEKNAKNPDGSTWAMKGFYQLKTEAQIVAERATGKGIDFTEDLSWEQVKALAKKENKYIFVDCFATWCIPCKKMEKEIFPLNIIGAEMNDKFISVRVQMDTTNKDDEKVRQWHPVAHEFLLAYYLTGYPSFLFFDANGNIVHKALGTYKAEDFIQLLKDVEDTNKQYYTLVNQYKKGKKDYQRLDYLASIAKNLGDRKLAEEVMEEYKDYYLTQLPLDSLLSNKYLKLSNEYQHLLIRADGSKGIFFKLLYEKGKEVDAILNLPGFAAFHIDGIITKEEIQEKIYRNGKPLAHPKWKQIQSSIKKKYSRIDAEKLLLTAQISYYQLKKDHNNQIKYLVAKAEKYGPLSLGNTDGSLSDNTIAGMILPYCENKEILNKAVGWMEQIIQSDAYKYPIAMAYGNYGGILYKAGRHKEGIKAFEKHLNAIGYKTSEDLNKDPRFKPKVHILEKMKRGEKIDSTWNVSQFN